MVILIELDNGHFNWALTFVTTPTSCLCSISIHLVTLRQSWDNNQGQNTPDFTEITWNVDNSISLWVSLTQNTDIRPFGSFTQHSAVSPVSELLGVATPLCGQNYAAQRQRPRRPGGADWGPSGSLFRLSQAPFWAKIKSSQRVAVGAMKLA